MNWLRQIWPATASKAQEVISATKMLNPHEVKEQVEPDGRNATFFSIHGNPKKTDRSRWSHRWKNVCYIVLHGCVWKLLVPHCTQWFCWSLSLWKMAISLGIYTIFRQTHIVNGDHQHFIRNNRNHQSQQSQLFKIIATGKNGSEVAIGLRRKHMEKWWILRRWCQFCICLVLLVVVPSFQESHGDISCWRTQRNHHRLG